MPSELWYYVKDGKSFPPVTWGALVQMARAGKLAANDQIWNESLPRWVPVSAVEGLIQQPAGYGRAPGSVYEAAAPGKSWLGAISLMMGVLFCILELIMVVVAGIMESQPGGMSEDAPETALLGLILLGGGAGASLGVILGLVAMFQSNANKVTAAFGIALNGVCAISIVALMLLGFVIGK